MKDPFIISSIIFAFTFLFILICNFKLKSKVIKISFLILSMIFIILVFILDNSYVYEFLKSLITYIWYPNYVLFVTTIIFSGIILMFTLLKKKISNFNKVVNYLLFSICFSCYITFIRFDIDPLLYSSLYSNKSLIVMRIVSITFIVWLIINFLIRIRGKYED